MTKASGKKQEVNEIQRTKWFWAVSVLGENYLSAFLKESGKEKRDGNLRYTGQNI